jgi:hypothetical protein
MDATFDIENVPKEYRPVRAAYPLRLPDGRDIEFRLPRGEDQESAAGWKGATQEEKRARFLRSCVLSGGEHLGDGGDQTLADAIEAVAPRASVEFAATCPECGWEFEQEIEPARWLIMELRRRFPQFEREVHLLSWHYHWPLREILALPRERRVRWAKLVEHEIDRARDMAASNR